MDIFDNLIGNFNGYALENLQEGNPDPALDTTDFSTFFSDDFGEVTPNEVQQRRRNLRKLKRKLRKRSKKVTFRPVRPRDPSGFGGGF